ncbi:uncharacterized protein [Littorina saxatilis]|uniref:Uncharacterized protein n=1 Tax=Littorina saxatilis TaxID=31220 RepID=A0AAN9BSB4_9CAEN
MATESHAPRSPARYLTLLSTLFLTLLLHTPRVDGLLSYPCPNPPNSRPPPSQEVMPKLASQFEIHVEANIVQKGTTVEAVEIYDYPNQRAAMSITSSNETVTSIFNYGTGERFDIQADGTCRTLNLSDSAFDVFGFTELRQSGRPTIMQAANVFRFGDDFEKVFLGEDVVRGIPVYHWQSCQTWKSGDVIRAAYVMDYFFSKPGYSTATAEPLIPVRAFINGTATNVDADGKPISGVHNFSHVYDFSFFRSGPVADEAVFEIPRGTVCQRSISKTMPQLPDQFSLYMEVYVAGSNRPPMTERMLFDYDFGLIQTDRFAPRGRGERFGLTELTIIEDYQNLVQYVIDSYDGNCSVKPMPAALSTSNGGKGQEISMKHGMQLLMYGQRDFKYQGQRTMRDMTVDVWADSSESGMVQEIYFLAGWPSARLRSKLNMMNMDLDLSRMNILVGTYLANTTAVKSGVGPFFGLFGDRALKQWGDRWQSNEGGPSPTRTSKVHRPGDLLRTRMPPPPPRGFRWDSARMHMAHAMEKTINIFNYLPMHMDMSAFDISMCYKKDVKEMYVYFSMKGSYGNVVSNQRYLFLSSIKTAMAKAAGINMLRIAKVNVWQDIVSSNLNIFFSMLEPPPVASDPPQLPCKDAFDKLTAAVDSGLTVPINHPLKRTDLEVVKGSLKSWETLDHLWANVMPGGGPSAAAVAAAAAGQKMPDSSAKTAGDGNVDASASGRSSSGYTHGQFGGMAFAMLVVGMLVGVVGMYVVLRRMRPDIHLLPYQQSK